MICDKCGKEVGDTAAHTCAVVTPFPPMMDQRETRPWRCPVCNGTGKVYQIPMSTDTNSVPCHACNGTGIAWARAVLAAVPSYADGRRDGVEQSVAFILRCKGDGKIPGAVHGASPTDVLTDLAFALREELVPPVTGASPAVPSYASGFADAKRMAVEKVEALPPKFLAIPPSEHRLAYMDEVVAAIRAIEPKQEGTHEERWAKAGWPFKWSDEHRAYIVGCDWYKAHDAMGVLPLPTVQAVGEWIAAVRTGRARRKEQP